MMHSHKVRRFFFTFFLTCGCSLAFSATSDAAVPQPPETSIASGTAQKQSIITSAIKISQELVAAIPQFDPAKTIGIRVQGSTASIVQRNGNFVRVDLGDGKITEGSLNADLLDFALSGNDLIALTRTGSLLGAVQKGWPMGPFKACRVECLNDDVVLNGDTDALYLAKNATGTIVLHDMPMIIPMQDGLLWCMRRGAPGRPWQAEFIDMFGNMMKRLYRFSPEFDPVGLTLGPLGPENELLLSFWTGAQRELSVIGPNGRMLWRIPVDDPVCPRDVAWGNKGDLLMIEREGTGIVLKRLKFAEPQG
ncbi:MAG: hypothetical protein WA705_14270 [Candidatus Ozemobacteraceae bacterium]